VEIRHPGALAVLAVVGLAALVAAIAIGGSGDLSMTRVSAEPLSEVSPNLVVAEQYTVGVGPYYGLGAWVDSYDADPAYTSGRPSVPPGDTAEMVAAGVQTLFMQAARSDDRATGPTTDPWVLAEFLMNAHADGLDVVGWYLPKWSADDEDLERLLAIHRFEVLGHRFDGLAVDIEWNRGELEDDPEERSRRLTLLSLGLREAVGSAVLGGIVMPPIVTDQINPDFWPGFPWSGVAGVYDVWLPMNYWSFRTEEHADPLYYSGENIRLLRQNLRNESAVVHGIGGVGAESGDVYGADEPLAGLDDMELFVQSLSETGAVGGSIYDWATTGDAARRRLAELFVEQRIG
tara:strand:- start:19149 stop:20189 length:1041 start_codon:yes stop_codon:yes gene_type:complete